MDREKVVATLRIACEKAGSAYMWAKNNGIKSQYVYMVLKGDRPPGPAILRALGLEREDERYRRRRQDAA